MGIPLEVVKAGNEFFPEPTGGTLSLLTGWFYLFWTSSPQNCKVVNLCYVTLKKSHLSSIFSSSPYVNFIVRNHGYVA